MINWFMSASALSTATTTIYNNGNHLGKCSWPAMGKQNVQAKEVYYGPYENDTATATGIPQTDLFCLCSFCFVLFYI